MTCNTIICYSRVTLTVLFPCPCSTSGKKMSIVRSEKRR